MKIFLTICASLVLVFAPAERGFAQTPDAKPAPVPAPRSVFTQPTSVHDGRDPFFPESTRVFDKNIVNSPTTTVVTELAIKGFSMVNGIPMVIINNHTFMAGDEGDVLSNGARVHVRCVEINTSTVIVEANGARQVLHF